MKHLDVLRGAGLVKTHRDGRLRINSLNAAPLREILERWIGKYEAYWSNTLLRVKEASESEQTKGKKGYTLVGFRQTAEGVTIAIVNRVN